MGCRLSVSLEMLLPCFWLHLMDLERNWSGRSAHVFLLVICCRWGDGLPQESRRKPYLRQCLVWREENLDESRPTVSQITSQTRFAFKRFEIEARAKSDIWVPSPAHRASFVEKTLLYGYWCALPIFENRVKSTSFVFFPKMIEGPGRSKLSRESNGWKRGTCPSRQGARVAGKEALLTYALYLDRWKSFGDILTLLWAIR